MIIGKKIYLRKLNIEDASIRYCNWLNDPEVNKYLETRKVTIEELRVYIKEKNEKNNCLLFGIFDKNKNEHIGNIKIEAFHTGVHIGILIGEREYWNKGIGTEATKLLVKHAFDTLDIKSIYLGVIPQNKGAIRIYEKVGFKVKQIIPNGIDHDGIKYDKIVMEIKKIG